MTLSLQSEELFQKNEPLIEKYWGKLALLQENPTYSAISEHLLDDVSQLKQVYYDYLWLLERLDHPKELNFFVTNFLPINGYLDGFFDLFADEVRLFKAEYIPNSIGEQDWRAISIANNNATFLEACDASFNIHYLIRSSFAAMFEDNLDLLTVDLLKKLESGEDVGAISKSQLFLLESSLPEVVLEKNKISISSVKSTATHLLPKLQHALKVNYYWCEHFETLYLFVLDQEMVLPHLKDLNRLNYLNKFLGVGSLKRFGGVWETREYGAVNFKYCDDRLVIESDSLKLRDEIQDRIRFIAR